MAIIAPFSALRFSPEKLACMEDVVTPPYDVIDDKGQAAFQARRDAYMKHRVIRCHFKKYLTPDR